jgi:hypothetical protein
MDLSTHQSKKRQRAEDKAGTAPKTDEKATVCVLWASNRWGRYPTPQKITTRYVP